MKYKRNDNKGKQVKNYFGYLIMIVMWSVIAYFGIEKLIEYYKIQKNFTVSKGVVDTCKKTGAKGAIYCGYRFDYKNQTYYGFDYNDTLHVGDSILIEFDKQNPNTNRFH